MSVATGLLTPLRVQVHVITGTTGEDYVPLELAQNIGAVFGASNNENTNIGSLISKDQSDGVYTVSTTTSANEYKIIAVCFGF